MERHRKVFFKMINHMGLSKKLMEKVFMSGKVNILKENPMVYLNAFAKISYGKKKKVQWELVTEFTIYIQTIGLSMVN